MAVDKPTVLSRKRNLLWRIGSVLLTTSAAESERRYRNCQYDDNDRVLHCFASFRELPLFSSHLVRRSAHGWPTNKILFVNRSPHANGVTPRYSRIASSDCQNSRQSAFPADLRQS